MNKLENTNLAPGQRRLQREADFTGSRLSSFRAVALRHGLPGALLGIACLGLPEATTMLQAGLSQAADNPTRGIVAGIVIFTALNLYAWYIDRSWGIEKAGWVLYLGGISVWEEWVFRVALPQTAESMGMTMISAVIVCNLLFGVAHYFTLRWRWQWCVGAFIGGMGFSWNFAELNNLVAIIYIHWIVTFLNTPRLPGSSATIPEPD